MNRSHWLLCTLLASLLVSPAAWAVNEHSEPDEAADRSAILKSEQTGRPLKQPLNIPNPEHDHVNSAGSHTPMEPTERQLPTHSGAPDNSVNGPSH